MDIISNELRRARKPHVCNWCGGSIAKGDTYRDQVNADGGSLWTWKNHVACGHFAAEYCEDYYGDGVSKDSFLDAVSDMAHEKGLDDTLGTYELVKKIMEAN